MITVAKGSLNVSKAIISEMFFVTRSAVTQTTKKKDSLEEDLIKRLYTFLKTKSSVKETFVKYATDGALKLAGNLKQIRTERVSPSKSGMGRPKKIINYSMIKKVIDAVVADIIAMAVTMVTATVNLAEELDQFGRKTHIVFADGSIRKVRPAFPADWESYGR